MARKKHYCQECPAPVASPGLCPTCRAQAYNVEPQKTLDSLPIASDCSPVGPARPGPDARTWEQTVAASSNDIADIFGIRGGGRTAIRNYQLSQQLWAEQDEQNRDLQERENQERERIESEFHRRRADFLSRGGRL